LFEKLVFENAFFLQVDLFQPSSKNKKVHFFCILTIFNQSMPTLKLQLKLWVPMKVWAFKKNCSDKKIFQEIFFKQIRVRTKISAPIFSCPFLVHIFSLAYEASVKLAQLNHDLGWWKVAP
jgi:hypothetical protein